MITPYTGQPITPGMIVCRRSVMTNGFASRPLVIVKVSGSRATVRDARDEFDTDARRINLDTIAFIVDTLAEGDAVARASLDFLERERRIEEQHQRERSERMRAAIAAAVGDAQAPQPVTKES